MLTLYRTAFAPGRKPYRTLGLLFTHKNRDFGAISVLTERSCAAPISKVKSHISHRCSAFSLPCEQRFRGMKWRAKSSLCWQPFKFLSCMRKIRHAIRQQLVRQICVSFAGIKVAKTTGQQLSSSFCFVFLLCPSGFKYFSRKISWDRLLRKHYATNCSKSCLIWGEHI